MAKAKPKKKPRPKPRKRKRPAPPDWCFLELAKGLQAKIDLADHPRVSQYAWRVIVARSGRKIVVTDFREGESRRQVTLGWFLMRPPEGKQVYARRYQEGLDYRKSNLVVCTAKERQRMLPKLREGTSRFRGVSFYPRSKRWRAGIRVDGKMIQLGLFDTEEQAAEAYNLAARRHFGQFAYQNRLDNSQLKRRWEDEVPASPTPVRKKSKR